MMWSRMWAKVLGVATPLQDPRPNSSTRIHWEDQSKLLFCSNETLMYNFSVRYAPQNHAKLCKCILQVKNKGLWHPKWGIAFIYSANLATIQVAVARWCAPLLYSILYWCLDMLFSILNGTFCVIVLIDGWFNVHISQLFHTFPV